MMAAIASYIIKKKVASLFKWQNIGKFLLNFFVAVSSGISIGLTAGIISDYLILEGVLTKQEALFFFGIFLSIPTLIVDIFPFLKPPVHFFKYYHPISLKSKLIINYTLYFFRNYSLFLLITHVLMVSISSTLFVQDIVSLSLFLLSAYLINRIIRDMLFFKHIYSKQISFFCLVELVVLVLIIWRLGNSSTAYVINTFVVIINFFLIAYFEKEKKERTKDIKEKGYQKGLFFRILANKNTLILISISFIFKTIILTLSGAYFIRTNKYLFGFEAFDWLFASSLMLFTYFGYNFFGINRNIFFTNALRVASTKNLFKIYSKVMLQLALIDALIFVSYVLLTGQYSTKAILFYLNSFVLFYFSAFLISLKFPVIKEKYYSLDFTKYGASTISVYASVSALIIAASTISATFFEFYWVVYLFLMGIAALLFLFVRLNIHEITQNFYKRSRALL